MIYNNTYYRTIKMKPVDGKSSTYIDFNRDNKKEPFLKKVTFQIGLKKSL